MCDVPELVWVAIDYLWDQCPDVKAQAGCESDEEWDKTYKEYRKWEESV